METNFILKNRVKELRARLNLNQAEVATDAGVTRQTILAIEKGRLTPSITVALRLARVLREPVDYVFYLDRVSEFDHIGVNDSAVEQPQVESMEMEPEALVASMAAPIIPVVLPAVVISPEQTLDPLADESVVEREIAGVENAALPVSATVQTPEEVVQPVSDAAPTRPAQDEPGAIFDFV